MRAVILDTGVANLSSLAFAVKRLGVEPIITREAAEIRAADRIFLPGVGTARAAMAAIEERGLADLIREATQPVLGICLGEQILGRRSEETGGVDLLGPTHGLPELLAGAAVVGLHLWKKNTLLSIAVGTALYMVLVQAVFV